MSHKQPREEDRIQCLECGKWFRALPRHILRRHGMTDEDYRLKYGIPVGLPLVCREWSANQSQRNRDQGLDRTLTARGPAPGYAQRESVRKHREPDYARLAESGLNALSGVDKTEARRERLKPYPVTVAQTSDRLQCTMRAAYVFLSMCVRTGRLARIGRGLYGESPRAKQ